MELCDLPSDSRKGDAAVGHGIDLAGAVVERLDANSVHRVGDRAAQELDVADCVTGCGAAVAH